MIDTFGMAGMIVLAILAVVVVYILMRVLGRPGDTDEEEADQPTVAPREISDREFIDSYTRPMLDDARGSLDVAVGSIQSGLYFYGRGAWEEASGEFHSAVEGIDAAADRLKEVAGMVEDQRLGPVREAIDRLAECRRMRALTIRMEEASDAMAAGKADEAQKHAKVKNELEQMISAFSQTP